MNNDAFQIDDSQVRNMFADLTSKNRNKVFRKAVSDSLNIVKKEAVNNLKKSVNPSTISKKDKYNNTLRKGIKVKVYKDKQSGVIHILGNYKLKFFELGTQMRKNKFKGTTPLKKPRNTGQINPSHFFTSAVRAKEKEVFDNIRQLIIKSIQKINQKYK